MVIVEFLGDLDISFPPFLIQKFSLVQEKSKTILCGPLTSGVFRIHFCTMAPRAVEVPRRLSAHGLMGWVWTAPRLKDTLLCVTPKHHHHNTAVTVTGPVSSGPEFSLFNGVVRLLGHSLGNGASSGSGLLQRGVGGAPWALALRAGLPCSLLRLACHRQAVGKVSEPHALGRPGTSLLLLNSRPAGPVTAVLRALAVETSAEAPSQATPRLPLSPSLD